MEINDYSYWLTLAHLPKWRAEKVNLLIFDIVHRQKISLAEFFSSNIATLQQEFHLSAKEAKDILQAKENLPNNLILADELLAQGFELIPLNSAKYPTTLSDNLKMKYSPPLLYVMGNTRLFSEDIVAIVGSRKVSE
jgi:predicted Rossmann fold nucleotide-binding protein DprA/Smf involved in DNA uptake